MCADNRRYIAYTLGEDEIFIVLQPLETLPDSRRRADRLDNTPGCSTVDISDSNSQRLSDCLLQLSFSSRLRCPETVPALNATSTVPASIWWSAMNEGTHKIYRLEQRATVSCIYVLCSRRNDACTSCIYLLHCSCSSSSNRSSLNTRICLLLLCYCNPSIVSFQKPFTAKTRSEVCQSLGLVELRDSMVTSERQRQSHWDYNESGSYMYSQVRCTADVSSRQFSVWFDEPYKREIRLLSIAVTRATGYINKTRSSATAEITAVGRCVYTPVSYTHLTLPTKRIV